MKFGVGQSPKRLEDQVLLSGGGDIRMTCRLQGPQMDLFIDHPSRMA